MWTVGISLQHAMELVLEYKTAGAHDICGNVKCYSARDVRPLRPGVPACRKVTESRTTAVVERMISGEKGCTPAAAKALYFRLGKGLTNKLFVVRQALLKRPERRWLQVCMQKRLKIAPHLALRLNLGFGTSPYESRLFTLHGSIKGDRNVSKRRKTFNLL